MDVYEAVLDTIQRHELMAPGDRVVVGVSGGPDSLCLLHVLQRAAAGMAVQLHVAHLHHGLRGADAAFVAETAAGWGLACTVARADVRALAAEAGLSIEEAARQARYGFLGDRALRETGNAVLVHPGSDQGPLTNGHRPGWQRGENEPWGRNSVPTPRYCAGR